jgi:hypothetical protein
VSAFIASSRVAHRTLKGWTTYNRPEDILVRDARMAVVFNGVTGEELFKGSYPAREMWWESYDLKRKAKSADLLELTASVPMETVAAINAMGAHKEAISKFALAVGHKFAMETAKHFFARRGAENRLEQLLEAPYCVTLGYLNRDKAAGLTINIVFKSSGKTKDGKIRAVSTRHLMKAQTELKSFASATIAREVWERFKINSEPTGTTGLKAAGIEVAKTERTKAIEKKTGRKIVSAKARRAAAQATRQAKFKAKEMPTFEKAMEAIDYKITEPTLLARAVNFLSRADKRLKRIAAVKAAKLAFYYHARSGQFQTTLWQINATTRQIVCPDITPKKAAAAVRFLARNTTFLARIGLEKVKQYADKNALFENTKEAANEKRLVSTLAMLTLQASKVRPERVIEATAGSDLDDREVTNLRNALANRVTISGSLDKAHLDAANIATKRGRAVYTIALDKKLCADSGLPAPISATTFLESTQRASHIQAFARAIREGGFGNDLLGRAGFIRRAKPANALRRGDILLISPQSMESRCTERLVKKAAKTGAHCILATGNALRLSQLTDVEIRRQQQSQRQGVRR